MRRLVWLIVMITGLWSIPSGTQAQVELMPVDATVFESIPCPAVYPRNAECGQLTVPENYDAPEGQQIVLRVVILRTPVSDKASDPIIYLAGGPGSSPLERLPRRYSAFFAPLLYTTGRDVIVFDQRGSGLSSPALDCPDYQNARLDLLDYSVDGELLSQVEVRVRLVRAFQDCGVRLASEADLSQYHSANSARDVQVLRQALGYDSVNLWGISYGTRLALTVLRDNPAGIRSVILDSVYPPDVNLFTDNSATRWRALDALLDTCAEDTACNTAYADVRERLSETVAALNTNPAEIFLSFPNESAHPVRFNGYLMLEMLSSFMYDSDLLPFMPYIITEAHGGNLRPFQDYLGYQFLRQTEISNGMYMAVQCREELAFTERGAIREAQQPPESRFDYVPTGIQGDDYLNICATFGTGNAPADENQAIASDVPALLLTGTYDPVTPPQWAYQAAETLSNSRVIEFPAQGHGVTAGDACGQQLLSDFVQSPDTTLEALDTSCVDDLRLDFYQGAPVDASADTS